SPSNGDVYAAVLPSKDIIAEINPVIALLKPGSAAYKLAKLSDSMDFDHPDSAPAKQLNEVIWKTVKGFNSTMPAIHTTRIKTKDQDKSKAKTAVRGSDARSTAQ